jgi:hypothetical protein
MACRAMQRPGEEKRELNVNSAGINVVAVVISVEEYTLNLVGDCNPAVALCPLRESDAHRTVSGLSTWCSTK